MCHIGTKTPGKAELEIKALCPGALGASFQTLTFEIASFLFLGC